MNYLHYKIKAEPSTFVRVTLNVKANVKLLDTLNYFKYKAGKTCEPSSEHLDVTSVEMKIPFKSTWHVVIEHSDYKGILKANVKVD